MSLVSHLLSGDDCVAYAYRSAYNVSVAKGKGCQLSRKFACVPLALSKHYPWLWTLFPRMGFPISLSFMLFRHLSCKYHTMNLREWTGYHVRYIKCLFWVCDLWFCFWRQPEIVTISSRTWRLRSAVRWGCWYVLFQHQNTLHSEISLSVRKRIEFNIDLLTYTPFTRYNRLSNWLYNRFDNRLYRVNGVLHLRFYLDQNYRMAKTEATGHCAWNQANCFTR